MKIILLDRDGVINYDSKAFIKSPEEWRPLPGSIAAIGRLYRAGYQVVLITNQSGLGRGLFNQAALDAMHQKLEHLLSLEGGALAAIYYCPHITEDACQCRKPKPGMFIQALNDFKAQGLDVMAVGDSKRDLQAALAAGCRPILVRTGNGEITSENLGPELGATPIYDDLSAFVDSLLL